MICQSLKDCISCFEIGLDMNTIHLIPVKVSNPTIWGVACASLDLFPHVFQHSLTDTKWREAIHQKLSSYWTETTRDFWRNFLVDMLDHPDSVDYCGSRCHFWKETLWLASDLDVSPFCNGLTQLQFTNNLVILGICSPPNLQEIANWIVRHLKLGAFGRRFHQSSLLAQQQQLHQSMQKPLIYHQGGIFSYLKVSMVSKYKV